MRIFWNFLRVSINKNCICNTCKEPQARHFFTSDLAINIISITLCITRISVQEMWLHTNILELLDCFPKNIMVLGYVFRERHGLHVRRKDIDIRLYTNQVTFPFVVFFVLWLKTLKTSQMSAQLPTLTFMESLHVLQSANEFRSFAKEVSGELVTNRQGVEDESFQSYSPCRLDLTMSPRRLCIVG